MPNIKEFPMSSGRQVKENGTFVNIADILAAIVINPDGSLSVKIAGADSNGGSINTNIKSSEIVQAFMMDSRLTSLIQTQAGVSILPAQTNTGAWIDSHVDGSPLTYLALSATMASGTGMTISIDFSHDGSTLFAGPSGFVYDGSRNSYATTEDIKLPTRYFRIAILNKDATNPKTTTAYAYLKA